MSMTRPHRYVKFGLIYFAEGAILSYFTVLNSLYPLSFDLKVSQVGLIGPCRRVGRIINRNQQIP